MFTVGSDLSGVFITGLYGSGKTSVAAEMAETLERIGVPYGAVDLDWLTWFEVPGLDQAALDRVYLENVTAMVENYRQAGVKRFIFAGSVASRDEVAAVEAAAGILLRTVRLTASPEVIEERLRADPVSGRINDLETVRRWIVEGAGLDVGDLVVTNDGRPIQETAREILDWLGWLRAP
ncbi:MAG TPA: hypothetical protein VF246_11370 [Acidimicrobiia bacterium]